MWILRQFCLLSAGLLLVACQSTGQPLVPALLNQPSAEERTLLEKAVEELLGRRVRLSETALTESSLLLLEPQGGTGIDGLLLDGRRQEPPERLRLYLWGDQCLLEHEASGKRQRLQSLNCKPL